MDRVLIIAPHPDDEVLGCGGTLLKHKEMGDDLNIIVCTDIDKQCGVGSVRNSFNSVVSVYEFSQVCELKFEDAKLEKYSVELIGEMQKGVKLIKPNIIYIPFQYDIHSDHRVVFSSAITLSKWFRFPYIKKILTMEIPSETEIGLKPFYPNYFVNITDYFERKIELLKMYNLDECKLPFPRSIEIVKALAMIRGSICGFKYAESFILIKEIEDR